MKKRTRILALLLVLVTVFSSMWIPAVSAATAEATLTITPEGGTATTHSGTYQDMHAKVASLTSAATVKTEYKIVLNSDAAYTKFVGFTVNENVVIVIDLNGHTLDVTNVKKQHLLFPRLCKLHS